MVAAAVIVIVVLLFAIASCDNSADYEAPQPPMPTTPPSHFESSQHWEKNHFIHKHLHRDDAKHARHKRNQTPW